MPTPVVRNVLISAAVQLALGLSLQAAAADTDRDVPALAAADPDSTQQAQADSGADPATQLGRISVDADEGAYQVQRASSPKYTEPLRDTAQTITVIPAELMQQQGTLMLRDILRENVPGITFGAGEGASYGDSINIRGFTATNDIAVDGVRQSANTTHSDPFNTQAIEVVQGVSSVYSGAGALAGTINYVSKLPQLTDFNTVSLGAGTADYLRATADVNHTVGPQELGMAFRLNAMAHRNDVAERDVSNYRRWGVAPSFAIGLGTSTSFTLSYLHEYDRNMPEYGIPLRNYATVPGISRETYYGFSNTDVERIIDDALTGILTHDFSDALHLRNLTRWEQYDRYSMTDAAEGRICLAPGDYPLGTNLQAPGTTLRCGAAGASALEGVGGPTYTPGGPIGNLRDTRNRIWANQTDFTATFHTGPVTHNLVAGAAFSREMYSQNTGREYLNANGTTYLLQPQPLYDPSNVFVQPVNLYITGHADSTLDNQAGYVFDTLKFEEHWLLGLGARYEHNKASYNSWAATPGLTLTAPPGPLVAAAGSPFIDDHNLLSYRATLAWKPVEPGTVYFAYGNSELPSSASVNSSCGTNCDVDPQKAVTYELGTKWDLLRQKLSLTFALFRTERQNYLVASGDPNVPEQQLDGKARVDGAQVGLAGNVTPDWAVFANFAYLRSKVLQSVSDHTLQQTGIDAQAGNPLANTPETSGNLWTTYNLHHGFTAGYGLNYSGRVWATANDYSPTAIYNRATVPGYVVHNLMASWQLNRNLTLQLNVNNLFNKEYLTQLRTVSTTSGWVYPGTGRTGILSATFAF